MTKNTYEIAQLLRHDWDSYNVPSAWEIAARELEQHAEQAKDKFTKLLLLQLAAASWSSARCVSIGHNRRDRYERNMKTVERKIEELEE